MEKANQIQQITLVPAMLDKQLGASVHIGVSAVAVDADGKIFLSQDSPRADVELTDADTEGGQFAVGTASPNAAALVQIDSTTQGFLPPRMTTAQRDAISSPPAGLLIYNTTTNKLNVYTTAWEAITSA